MPRPFKFSIRSSGWTPRNSSFQGFLVKDSWDDFSFRTLYKLIVVNEPGERMEVGYLKIGQLGMGEDQLSPRLPDEFEILDEPFFSLGQDESYYDNIGKLGANLRVLLLTALRDIAFSEETWQKVKTENVTGTSLLRSVTIKTLEGQFRRLAHGGARLTRFNFSYSPPAFDQESKAPPPLEFKIEPESFPPTNVHVLIGRNGVGKTNLINRMCCSILRLPDSGYFEVPGTEDNTLPFANLVSVSFSAFDTFEPVSDLNKSQIKLDRIKCSYVGLRRPKTSTEENPASKTPHELAYEFVEGYKICKVGDRASRWRNAIQTLEADPMLKEYDITSKDSEAAVLETFDRLSSGHKIVVLTITRLVEAVEEKTLVLLDEPESHLHPPLLSAFVRALSNLLMDRNAVAIVATHSPVVLQEVPKSCVWIVRRTGREVNIERPVMETFGENVGVLTRQVFSLEVVHSGFHKMLADAAKQNVSFESAVEHFGGELGGEARAILRTMFLDREEGTEQG